MSTGLADSIYMYKYSFRDNCGDPEGRMGLRNTVIFNAMTRASAHCCFSNMSVDEDKKGLSAFFDKMSDGGLMKLRTSPHDYALDPFNPTLENIKGAINDALEMIYKL